MDQSAQQEGNGSRSEQAQNVHYCTFHPDVETGLSCSRCDNYICTRCMVQAPVGIRCRECSQVQKLPTFDVRPSYYMRASVAGGLVGVVSGIVMGGVTVLLPYVVIPWALAIGTGYTIGAAISASTNRKRGTGLMIVGGASLMVAIVSAGLIESGIFSAFFARLDGLLFLAVSLFVAVNRVR